MSVLINSLAFFQAVSSGARDVLLNPVYRKSFDDMDAPSFWLGSSWFQIVVYVLSYITMFLKVDDSENEFHIIKARHKILRKTHPQKTDVLKHLNFSKILFSKSTAVTCRIFAMFCRC